MRHHKGPSPKRTVLLSSLKQVGYMDRGNLTLKGHKSDVALVLKYIDGSGKRRWQGTSSLKGSQCLGTLFRSLLWPMYWETGIDQDIGF